MFKGYQQLLSDSTSVRNLLAWDREEAQRFQLKEVCPHCGGVLDRADYDRRLRGLKTDLGRVETRRISFCCRVCRRRSRPPSLIFLDHKVYGFLPVFLTLSLFSGRVSGMIIRRICSLSGACEVTLRRWRWWMARFISSARWKLLRRTISALLCLKRFPLSLFEEFLKRSDLKEAVFASLRYLSVLSFEAFLPNGEISALQLMEGAGSAEVVR